MNNDSLHSENHLTAQQMQDYLSGNLPDVEMHRIEKHMLECDFCAEAMEGLEAIDDFSHFEKDLSDLRTRVEKRAQSPEKETVVVPLYNKALRIAAMLAVLIVASVLVTNYFKSRVEQKEYSERKKIEAPKEKKIEEKGEEKQIELSSDSTLKPAKEKSPKGAQESAKPESVEEEPVIKNKIDLVDNNKQAKPIEPVAEEEIVMDEVVVLDHEIITTEADAAEEDLADVESIKVEEEMVMGMETTDVAIPASAKGRSMYTAAGADAKSAQKKNVSKLEIIQPQPMDNNAFQQYLKDSLRYPDEAIEAKIKGTVTLHFIVESNGEISQIEVIKSLGFGCDKEAIRLLKDGPIWIPGSEDNQPTEMEAELKVKFK